MAWYDRFLGRTAELEEKENPSQFLIARDEGLSLDSRESVTNYKNAYEQLEVVNRAVNMIVDDAADIPFDVGEPVVGINNIIKQIRRSRVDLLLNKEPNPFQDVNSFKRNLIIDLLIDGNIFVYFDGVHLYHLPAEHVTIETDEKTYVNKYTYDHSVDYTPKEIIHIKENSFNSIYRGVPRLKPAWRTMQLLGSMRRFQDNFFKNGAVPGLVLKSPNTLSEKIKERMLAAWVARYNPQSGGRRPLFLDGGLEVENLTEVNFKDLDFQEAITSNEKIILKAMGIPPILLDGGNNANIRPNHRLYYLETILPIVRKIGYAFERFFGFKLDEEISGVPALQPEMRDQAGYYSTLVNTGILTPNEAREALRFEKIDGFDTPRVPANIAGSAANPEEGGRPTEDSPDEEKL
ncbi:MAG TPA: phage portal protein [Saprospirales bacterium]|jgi:HK97 family phage portal protein|nr:phage portal protein [Saprospirales bacterium]